MRVGVASRQIRGQMAPSDFATSLGQGDVNVYVCVLGGGGVARLWGCEASCFPAQSPQVRMHWSGLRSLLLPGLGAASLRPNSKACWAPHRAPALGEANLTGPPPQPQKTPAVLRGEVPQCSLRPCPKLNANACSAPHPLPMTWYSGKTLSFNIAYSAWPGSFFLSLSFHAFTLGTRICSTGLLRGLK